MKKATEKYFKSAMTAISDILQEEDSSKEISREYQAYAASFGSSILQMGLLPTLAVYADQESGSAKDRSKLLKVLAKTLTACDGLKNEPLKQKIRDNAHDLYKTVVSNDVMKDEFRRHLLDAIVAVKLSLRTFKLSKP
jgi:CRISPR type III-B/RAMP module-associated protein Cmr5